MPEIGTTLRETRIRDKIDITTVEEATKIRAKYLRALENEEWGVLPGPAYIKSFLRTYAEFLGLDAHMLVEEYRARFERPEELELPAFARHQTMRRRVRPPGPPSRGWVVAALALGLLAILFVLGITGDEEKTSTERSSTQERERTESASAAERARRAREERAQRQERSASAPDVVRVLVVPERDAWVCLVDAKGRRLVEGRIVTGGESEGPFKSARFRITVGNGGGDFKVNGKLRDVPDTSHPLGYAITPSGTRLLAEDQRPTCEAS